MRGCALRKVVRNLAHKKLENRGVEPQHLPSQIPRPAPTGWSPVGWWMAEKPGAEGSPRAPGEKTAALLIPYVPTGARYRQKVPGKVPQRYHEHHRKAFDWKMRKPQAPQEAR